MVEPEDRFYTRERWQNWLTRVKEEEIDPEDEESGRLLINLQDDAAIAVAKVLSAYDDERLGQDEAVDEINRIGDIVLSEPEFEDEAVDEETLMYVSGIQQRLYCAFNAAAEYVVAGVADEHSIEEYVELAAEAEEGEDVDAAFGYLVQAGTRIIDGEELEIEIIESYDYGLVSEWVTGLDSLQDALRGPEVIEDEDEA